MMAQAIRQTTFVQSEGKIEIRSSELPQGAKVEVIVIFEDEAEIMSAEALAIKRLDQLNDPSQLITVIEADQEIDENELKQWVAGHGS
jgi:streptogramin lyase